MNPYRALSLWNWLRAIARGRLPQRTWNWALGRGAFRILRKFFK